MHGTVHSRGPGRNLMRGGALAAALAAALAVASQAAAQAPAEETPAALARVYACAQMNNEEERLACYDSAVGRLKQAETGGEFVAVDRARVEEVERDSFGFNLPSLTRLIPRFGFGSRPAQAGAAATASAPTASAAAVAARDPQGGLSELHSTISRVVQRNGGRYAFELANGQVWTQIEPERTGNVRQGTAITIRRAAFGSFMLVSERGGVGHRVRREE